MTIPVHRFTGAGSSFLAREDDAIEADFRRMRAGGWAPIGQPIEDETGDGPLGAFAFIALGLVAGCLLTLGMVWVAT